MFHPAPKLHGQLHVQGDFIVYGYGGFYPYPKGWGLDIAYINRTHFKGPLAKARVQKIIAAEVEKTVASGIATELFAPAFIGRLKHIAHYEWSFEKSRLLFEYCKASFPQFKRYADFQAFAKECIGALPARTPMELEEITLSKVRSFMTENMEKVIEAQHYLQQRHAEDVLRRIFTDMLGLADGIALFQQALAANGGASLSLEPEKFFNSFFVSGPFIKLLKDWHWQKMHYWSQTETIRRELKTLRWEKPDKKTIARAKRDTMRGLKQMPAALIELLYRLQLPLFIATAENANFFRYLFDGIPMCVTKDSEELQEYTVFGVCMYQPYYRGGVVVTRGQHPFPRFFHTLVEEISHLADGPEDRATIRGHHRYSGRREFHEAYQADRAAIAPWHRTGILGAKEWGQALTKKCINPFTRARVQKRIEQYNATLDFDHYEPSARAAEIFAALPVLEKAVGKQLVRKIMPNLFRFYDEVYKASLKAEIHNLHKI